jgi:cell division protein FtsB
VKQVEQITAWCYRARRRFAAMGVGLLVCVLAYHVVFGANGMVVYAHKRSELRRSQQEIEALARENERLKQRIQALKSDPATIEKEAREQLRYTRPGEAVYVLPEPAQKPAPPMAAEKR